MNIATLSLLVFISIAVAKRLEQLGNKCLPGNNHKLSPSPEKSLLGCEVYKEKSCCTSEFTEELANSPIHKIGNFSWTQCNNTLSPRCEAFMVHIECFYRCSHNAIFWRNPNYPSAIKHAPVCASFCDGWFDACKNDLTCAKNWIIDFNMSAYGANTCKNPCKTFSQYFRGGKELCESMWGTSFVYKGTDCLQLNFTLPNPNDDLVKKLFGGSNGKPKSRSLACISSFKITALVINFVAFLSLK